MGIVKLIKKYKLLGSLNKYSLLVIYGGFYLILFSYFYLLKSLRIYLMILFISISFYLVYKHRKPWSVQDQWPLFLKDCCD